MASDWFVQHYRMAFPKFAQDREYWPEVEACLRERFKKGGDGPFWRAACNDGKDAMKTPSIFTTIEAYNERVNIQAAATANPNYGHVFGEIENPETKQVVNLLVTRMKSKSSDGEHTSMPGNASNAARRALAAIAAMKADGVKPERFAVAERHYYDQLDQQGLA